MSDAGPQGEPEPPAEPDGPSPRRAGVGGGLLAVVGVAFGLLLGAVVVVGSDLIRDGGTAGEGPVIDLSSVPIGPRPSARAADALVVAVRRSRLATFALVEDFVRVAPNGVEAVATRTTRVQRPPDSLVRTDQTLDLVRAGRHTACSVGSDTGGRFRCRSEPAVAVDTEAALADQAALVTGQAPLYTVADAGGGCFVLALRVERTAPPYGRRATLCYDTATGAPARSEITKADGKGGEVVDRTTSSHIRGEVTDADLALPPDAVPG